MISSNKCGNRKHMIQNRSVPDVTTTMTLFFGGLWNSYLILKNIPLNTNIGHNSLNLRDSYEKC